MKEKWYRRLAYASVMLTEVVMAFCFLVAGQVRGQDTVHFNAVEIKIIKYNLTELGKKTEHLDSSSKAQFRLNSLNEVLSNQSSVFIKSYGAGALATSALRGGNASQTAIVWNGFNLQNTMLGQTDLSQLPSFLFDDVALCYGGSSSVWGSGAIAGSILLRSAPKFNSGLFSQVTLGAGSFGKLNSTAVVQFGKKKFFSSTKVYLNSCENNFKYLDTSDHDQEEKYAKNASYAAKGLMQDFDFVLKKNQTLSVSAWLHDASHRIQALDPQDESKASQKDQALRYTAHWSYSTSRMHSSIRSAFLQDKIVYTDSFSKVYSTSKTRTFMLENDNQMTWLRKQRFNISAYVLKSVANTDQYDTEKTLTRVSLLAGNRSFFLRDKVITYISLRVEHYSINTLPLTGNISIDYKPWPDLCLKFNTSKVYRQPTLNELYWQPGGNSELKPETGYTYEGEMNYTKKIKSLSFFVSLAAYSRKISDWILWVPGSNGNPSPQNIQKVWSRGTETTWRITYQNRDFKTGISLMSAYVLATVESSSQENDNAIHKQLMYTPRYSFNTNAFINLKHWSLFYYHQYFGYRFTSSDNSSWLNPYQVASLRLNYSYQFNQVSCHLFASCNNVFNQNYTIILQRPMPLRNYELGITFQLNKKNNPI